MHAYIHAHNGCICIWITSCEHSSRQDVIIKTLIAAHPILKHNYRSCFPNHTRGSACFEILGFDVLLDRKLKPWLIEVGGAATTPTTAYY